MAVCAGWLIDGGGGPVRQNVRITVNDGIIAGLRDAPAEPEGSAPQAIPDFSDCTVIPGLVDSHVHLTSDRAGVEIVRAGGGSFARRLRSATVTAGSSTTITARFLRRRA